MSDFLEQIQKDIEQIASEWIKSDYLHRGDLFVIGCSTSEVAGQRIGTAGSEEIAGRIFNSLQKLRQETGVHLVFQCCEHINRALIIEKEAAEPYNYLEEVSVIPIPTAGGAMASYAYKNMKEPVVFESIKANAGIDIGETMIGMHLKHVAIPLRFKQKTVGNARITGARTRPKMVGGARASYQNNWDKKFYT